MTSRTQKPKMPTDPKQIEKLQGLLFKLIENGALDDNYEEENVVELSDRDKEKKLLRGYDTHLDFEKREDFTIVKLNKYFEEDMEALDPEEYIEHFNITKSFKYFNHFHYSNFNDGKIYKIIGNEITPMVGLKETFNYLSYESKKIKFKFSGLYNKSKFKKLISGFEFNPLNKIKNDNYNLFLGFKYDSEDRSYNIEDIKPFLDHLKFVCNDEEIVYNYFISWISHILQFPARKTDCAIVLFSYYEGIGKNIISDTLRKIFDGYVAQITSTATLADKFNSNMMGKLFVIGDEVSGKSQNIANEMKDIITRKMENIEFKNKDVFNINDYKNYYFTTNNENTFKVSTSDRRFMFIECPEKIKSPSYFINLYKHINDDNFMRQLSNYFMTYDITEFQSNLPPMTKYKENLIEASYPGYVKFITEEYDNYINVEYSISDLYTHCVNYCNRNHIGKSDFTKASFSHRFKKIFEEFQYTKGKNQNSFYLFPSEKKDEIMDIVKKNLKIERC